MSEIQIRLHRVVPMEIYRINAAAKQHERLSDANRLFAEAVESMETFAIGPHWFIAKARNSVAFGVTAQIAERKCEAGLREQLLSGLRVV
jgi:hypothetical protein